MRIIFNAIDRTSDWGGVGSSLCILIIVILILVEIIVRTISGQSTFITEEYSGYLLCWFAFLGMAYTLKSDGHIRVTMLLSRAGVRKRVFLEMIAGVIGLAAFAYMTVYLTNLLYDSMTMGVRSMHVSETPLFIPQIIPVVGSALMALQFLSYLAARWREVSSGQKREGDVSDG
jgi:TRAP-type C4-dicarboxylate transport system permease small subunit